MMNRTNQILSAVLTVQILLAGFLLWPRSEVRQTGAAFIQDVEATAIDRIEITDETAQQIVLQRSGAEWVLPAADDYPAKSASVEELLGKILTLVRGDVITADETSWRALQVSGDLFSRRIMLHTSTGTEYVLYLGSSPAHGSIHIRLDGENETYLIRDLSANDTQAIAGNWIDTSYLAVVAEDVQAIQLVNAAGDFALENQGDSGWVLTDLSPGEILNTFGVNTLLSRATAVTMIAPLGLSELPEYGLQNPLAEVTLVLEGEVIILAIGVQDESDLSYFAKASTSDYYVKLREFVVSELLTYSRTDLLEIIEPEELLPETPAAEVATQEPTLEATPEETATND